jgi:transposase
MSSSDGGDRGVQSDKSARRRRRSYSEDEKQRLVAESCEPGASVSGVAQRHGINANLLFTWRRQMRPLPTAEAAVELIPVEIVSAPESSPAMAATERRGAIEISLVGGARVQVDANVNEAALKRVLSALKAMT